MTLPSFNAEQSLYRSSRHYRSSTLASTVAGIRPSAPLTIPQQVQQGSLGYVPPGNYQSSCITYDTNYCTYDGFTLFCNCLDECGNEHLSGFINVPDCADDVNNCNGWLTCGPC